MLREAKGKPWLRIHPVFSSARASWMLGADPPRVCAEVISQAQGVDKLVPVPGTGMSCRRLASTTYLGWD